MRRVVLRWVAAFAAVVLVGVGSVAVVVSVGFGPGSFVTTYLDALARRDAPSALALPGVDAAGGNPALLTSAALPGLHDIRITDDVEHDGGIHRITASWVSHDTAGQSTFEVQRIGTRFGVFPVWGFAESPVAQLSLDVRNSREVSAGDQRVRTPGVGAHDYALLVPGEYRFVERTALLVSAERPVVADTVGQRFGATVDVEASPRFVALVSTQVDKLLDRCATQKVLFPTGCPFGQQIDNRVTGTPAWSMKRYPEMRLVGAGDDRSWTIPQIPATAHLKVQVQSLYDGTTSTFDKDVPFTIRATVRVSDDGEMTISDVE
jgi:hypothetical protein